MLILHIVYFVSGHRLMSNLSQRAATRIQSAFRPKTQRCYKMLFRTFVAFCVFVNLSLKKVNGKNVISFLEYLAQQNTSVHMLANYVAAIKANFIIYNLDKSCATDPKIKYFLKSVRINRPLAVPRRNIMSVKVLKHLVSLCDGLVMGFVYKAVFLVGFFGFLRLSNIAPHSLTSFDASRHLAAGDIVFTKTHVKVIIKWSKTNQNRDKIHVLSLPRIRGSNICPFRALKRIFKSYHPEHDQPLFQIQTTKGWSILTDTRIRKTLSTLNVKMGYHKHYFTFHTFRRSGATLAFNSQVPIQKIQRHGAWASECVWRYIKQDPKMGEDIADTFAQILHNA